jgi:hypothetical protein
MVGIDSYYNNLQSVCTVSWNLRNPLDIKNFAPKSEGYSDKIQIFFQCYGRRFSKIFVNLKKSRHYFKKLYIQTVDFCNSYRSQKSRCLSVCWGSLLTEVLFGFELIKFPLFSQLLNTNHFEIIQLNFYCFFSEMKWELMKKLKSGTFFRPIKTLGNAKIKFTILRASKLS